MYFTHENYASHSQKFCILERFRTPDIETKKEKKKKTTMGQHLQTTI